jgi:hypothetical protein
MTNEELKEKLKQQQFEAVEKIEIIQQYILDLKQQQVKINMPLDMINVMLLEQAFNISKAYYLNKFEQEENGSKSGETD